MSDVRISSPRSGYGGYDIFKAIKLEKSASSRESEQSPSFSVIPLAKMNNYSLFLSPPLPPISNHWFSSSFSLMEVKLSPDYVRANNNKNGYFESLIEEEGLNDPGIIA